jgi:SHS2 domain-containing protein
MHADGTGYSFIDHTADLGVRATATNLPDLFIQAAKGMYALLGRLEPGTEPVEKVLQLQAPDAESLLHDWLSELLWELDGNGHLFDTLEFEWLDEQHLTARCRGTVLDAQRSERTVEMKAVTYHDLRIQKHGDNYEVTVIFDI